MDTPLRLEFELSDEERRHFWRRQARLETRLSLLQYLAGFVIFGVAALMGALLRGPAWIVPFAFGAAIHALLMTTFPPSEARILRTLPRRGAHRFALRYVQGLDLDHTGATATRHQLLGRQRIGWSEVNEAIRTPDYFYIRQGGIQFIIPDRVFQSEESLARFEGDGAGASATGGLARALVLNAYVRAVYRRLPSRARFRPPAPHARRRLEV
jgi:hypothetical protein